MIGHEDSPTWEVQESQGKFLIRATTRCSTRYPVLHISRKEDAELICLLYNVLGSEAVGKLLMKAAFQYSSLEDASRLSDALDELARLKGALKTNPPTRGK